MVEITRLARYRAGVPVYGYVVDPSVPPVSVVRLHRGALAEARRARHAHDFPSLAFFERGSGTLSSGESGQRPIEAGDLYVVAPGVVMEPGDDDALAGARGSSVFFIPEALDRDRPEPLASWRAHPLLFPFVGGTANGALRLRVPPERRAAWVAGIGALETELTQRREGYRQAAVAQLILLLVDVARLATDVLGDVRATDETLLATVFAVIEGRYRERLSPRDVARAVSLTPGYLTTVVRRKTGRTLQDWITERRMTEARRLLEETELPIGEVSRRVGVEDASYFARAFRRAHGVPPRSWRDRAARRSPLSPIAAGAGSAASPPRASRPTPATSPPPSGRRAGGRLDARAGSARSGWES